MGLLATDDLDAMKCFEAGAAPTPTPTRAATRTPTPSTVVGDVTCNRTVDSIDAAVARQFIAGLIRSLRCEPNAAGSKSVISSISAVALIKN
jgi:hypothetical protein